MVWPGLLAGRYGAREAFFVGGEGWYRLACKGVVWAGVSRTHGPKWELTEVAKRAAAAEVYFVELWL